MKTISCPKCKSEVVLDIRKAVDLMEKSLDVLIVDLILDLLSDDSVRNG